MLGLWDGGAAGSGGDLLKGKFPAGVSLGLSKFDQQLATVAPDAKTKIAGDRTAIGP
jgi:hypothetical protein